MEPIRTLIFDFDGTLANTQDAIRHAFVSTLQDLNSPIPIAPFLDTISCRTLEGMFQEVGVKDDAMVDVAVFQYCRKYRAIGSGKTSLFQSSSKG